MISCRSSVLVGNAQHNPVNHSERENLRLLEFLTTYDKEGKHRYILEILGNWQSWTCVKLFRVIATRYDTRVWRCQQNWIGI